VQLLRHEKVTPKTAKVSHTFSTAVEKTELIFRVGELATNCGMQAAA
jgi:hypothetical protein